MKSKKTTKRDPNEEEKDPTKIKKIQDPGKPTPQRVDTTDLDDPVRSGQRRTGDIPGRPSGLGDLGYS